MAAPLLYAAPARDGLLFADLPPFTATFHRASGITHLLIEPAPQILAVLAGTAMTLAALRGRLEEQYDLAGADDAVLAARVAELVEAGLVRVE